VSIASITSNPNWLSQISGQNPLSATRTISSGSASSSTSAIGGGTSAATSGGSLLQDIISTLQSMLPVSAATATAGSSATATGGAPSKAQDLQSFLSTLMQSLHQAGTAATSPAATGTAATGTAAVGTATPVVASGALGAYGSQAHHGHGHGHKHGGGMVATQLETLLQEVNGGSTGAGAVGSTSTTGSAGTSAVSPPTTSGATQQVAALQSSYSQLMSALGTSSAANTGAASSPSLQSFLQTLLGKLQPQNAASPNVGQLLNATA
jgi:hypothetical protein